jgi:hypothetical protein
MTPILSFEKVGFQLQQSKNTPMECFVKNSDASLGLSSMSRKSKSKRVDVGKELDRNLPDTWKLPNTYSFPSYLAQGRFRGKRRTALDQVDQAQRLGFTDIVIEFEVPVDPVV